MRNHLSYLGENDLLSIHLRNQGNEDVRALLENTNLLMEGIRSLQGEVRNLRELVKEARAETRSIESQLVGIKNALHNI